MLFLLFVQIELRIGSPVGIINRIIGLHIINPGGKMDCLIRCDNLQVTNNTLRQMDSQIRRVINKNNTEFIAAEANGVIALRIDVLIAFANRVIIRSPSRCPVSLISFNLSQSIATNVTGVPVLTSVAVAVPAPVLIFYGCKARSWHR